MRAARRKPILGTTQLVLLLAAGCSLQDFDYLQKSPGGTGNGGSASSTAGSSSAGSDSEGGEPPSSAGTGGTRANGGTDAGAANGGGSTSGGSTSGGSTSGNANGGTGGSASGGKGGSGGSGATGELVNGSFETGNTKGWTVEPATALMNPPRYAYVQTATSGAVVVDGIYEFSTWHAKDEFTVDLFQTIEGLEDGVYVFKGYFNLGKSHKSIQLYAKDCGGADPDPTPITPSGDDSAWPFYTVENIEVKGGKCTVGVEISSNPEGWLNADLFTFERVGDHGSGGAGGDGGDGQGGAN